MEILSKHYEKLILAICLVIMILGLMKVSDVVREARDTAAQDQQQRKGVINREAGEMVPDFDPEKFKSTEEWIQRVKDDAPADVLTIDSHFSEESGSPDDVTSKWDRRYFSILTKHSQKPIEETEAKYRLDKSNERLEQLKSNVRQCEERIKVREAMVAKKEISADDDKLLELKRQAEGFKSMIANAESDIYALKKRIFYLKFYCSEHGSLIDPQEIICCCNDRCGALIRSTRDKCPFCGQEQKPVNPAVDDSLDSDEDGMPDSFELQHILRKNLASGTSKKSSGNAMKDGQKGTETPGVLNPNNKSDAYEDFDGDSFTNLEEYRFKTDIDDELDHPDFAKMFRLLKFEQMLIPIKFVGINKGRGDKDPEEKWRAKFIRLNRRGQWVQRSDDDVEQLRVEKRIQFKDEDGTEKQFVVKKIGEAQIDGQTKAFVTLQEYVQPAKKSRTKRGAEQQESAPVADQKTQKTYTLYENEDGYFETWYANIVFLATRNVNYLNDIYRDRYEFSVDAKRIPVKTVFKLKANDTFKITVPFVKQKAAAVVEKKEERNSRIRNDEEERTRMGEEESSTRMESREVEVKEFEYKVTKFNRENNEIEVKAVERKDAEAEKLPLFDEHETFTLGGREFPLLFEGSSNNGNYEGREEGGMPGERSRREERPVPQMPSRGRRR